MLDTVAPLAPTLALGTGVAAGATQAEATQPTGVVTLTGELSAAIAVTFTGTNGSVTVNLTGTGASQAVTLLADDLITLGEGTVDVSAIQTDGAGNTGPAGTISFVLDTVAPLAPTLGLGQDVAAGATQAEATQLSGVVTLTGELSAAIAVTFTGTKGSVTQNVVGTGDFQAVTLLAGDLVTLGNGTVDVSAVPTDVAGNTGPAGTISFILDTVAPLAPTLALGTGVADGATQAEATQPTGVVTVSGELDAALAITFTGTNGSVTINVVGTGNFQPISLLDDDLTTLGNGIVYVTAIATDVAANIGQAGTISFRLDTVAPLAPTLALGTGVADGATQTKATQPTGVVTLTGELSAAIAVTFTGSSGSVTKNVVGTGASQSVRLLAGDLVTLGNGTVDVSAIPTDVAGNIGPAGTISFELDTVAPEVVEFTSSSPDGTYGTAAKIALIATLSEPVQAGGLIAVQLNTGAVVYLTAAVQGTTLTGDYIVNPGEVIGDLDVISYQMLVVITDIAGNRMTSMALPEVAGQLATLKQIAINAAVSATAAGFSTDATRIADKKIGVRLVPITFTTPVRGVTLSAFRLYFNGRSISLAGATVTGSGANYILRLPLRATKLKGIYTLKILAGTAIAASANGVAMTQAAQIYWGYGRSVGMAVTPKAVAFSRL